jgi:hypothetical protein
MTAAAAEMNAQVPDGPGSVDPGLSRNMRPELGDTLVIDGAGMAGLPLLGTIVAVYGDDGAPPYLVRWTAGDYESRVFPGAGARIEKHR